jgi:protein phosphatase
MTPDAPATPGPSAMLSSAHRTHVGQTRKVNQDSLLVMEMDRVNLSRSNPLGVYVVADGLGGQQTGEVASGLVVATIATCAQNELFKWFNDGSLVETDVLDWLRKTISLTNQAVLKKREEAGSNMDSTMVMMVVEGLKAYVAHVGDSRAYLLTNSGDLERLTYDHSLVEQLVLAKQITPAQARKHPQKNVIYRTMGQKDVEAEIRSFQMEPGDRLVLCCDGLHSMIEDEQLAALAREAVSPADAARKLVDAANEAGGSDNISVIVVEAVAA